LNKIAEFARFSPGPEAVNFGKHFYPAMMEALFACDSWIAVVMLTDLLRRKYRFNVPGTAASSNWTRRMQRTISQLNSSRSVRERMRLMRVLLEKTGRA
jgi:4-alpha-glucanotransferase